MAGARTDRVRGHGEAWLLAGVLLGGGDMLYRLAGGPRLPTSPPDGGALLATLTGTTIPYDALGAFCTTLAWALWLWLTATLLLQLLLSLADAATSGARWVRSLRAVIDPLTLPAVRRLVHGTAIAFTVAQLAVRSASGASAAPAPAVTPVAAAAPSHSPATLTQAAEDSVETYTVQPGDTLWALAARFYGNGEDWPKLVAANVGRRMPDGQVFPRNPVLQPGWVLRIPEAQPASAEVPSVTYVVRDGDDLRSIAQRYYHDEMLWPRIFDANRGAHLPDGRTLTNPDLIWPGLVLRIPGVTPAPPAPPPPQPPRPAPAQAQQPVAAAQGSPASPHVSPAVPPPVVTPAAPTPGPAASPAAAASPAPRETRATITPMPTAIPAPPAAPPSPVSLAPHPAPTTAPLPISAAGLAALAALGAGGTVLLARRRRPEPGIPADRDAGIPIRGGYADPAHAPTFAHRLYGGGEPALLVAEQVQRALSELGLGEARIVAVREGRHTVTLTLDGSLAVRRRLLDLEAPLAERLSALVKARPTADDDVTIQLSRLGQLRLVAPPSGEVVPPLPLVAMGVLPTREALHVNWDAVGSMLVAGAPGCGADVVLASVLTALAARCHPDALRISIVAPRDMLPEPLHALPHLARPVVDPGPTDAVQALLDELAAELDRRADGGAEHAPTRLLVVGELDRVPDDALLPLLERGPALGIRVLAATARPEALSDALVGAVGTVLLLRLADEEQSVRLVGTPDAATLDDGELLGRLEGRVPVRLRAFRVEDRHLERLVEQMRVAYRRMEQPPDRGDGAERAEEAPSPEAAEAEREEAEGQPVTAEATPGAPTAAVPAVIEVPTVVAMADRADAPPPPDALAPAERAAMEATPVTPAPATIAAPEQPPTVATAERTPLLYVRCFGPLQVRCGERELSCMHQYQAWELLAYLATQGGGASRQEVLDTFWPGADDATAGNRLDQLVYKLKKVLTAQAGEGARDLVSRERGRLSLEAGVVASDLQHFHALLDERPRLPPTEIVPALEASLALAGDELLAGAEYAWLEQPGEDGLTLRERYQEQMARLRHELACRYRDRGEVDRAVALFRQLLDEQPTLQPAARGLYRCYAIVQDRGALEEAHARLVAALRHERAAGTGGADFTLHPKTVAAYQQALEEIQKRVGPSDSGA